MTDEEVAYLESLLARTDGTLYYNDTFDGCLVKIRAITHNHRFYVDHKGQVDPNEIPESAAWLDNQLAKCIGLLNASPEDFKFMIEMKLEFPE